MNRLFVALVLSVCASSLVHAAQPTAVADAVPFSGSAPLDVQFDGSDSSDPDGHALTFSWDFGDFTPPSTDPDPMHTYTSPGTYVATLVVTDPDGLTDLDTVTILVTAPNNPPIAVATVSPLGGSAPLDVQLSSTGSSDPDGDPLTFSWDFGDFTPPSTDPNPMHTYINPGTYVATLTVSDGLDGDLDTATIIVTDPNNPPIAVADVTPLGGPAPLDVQFSGDDSSDPDGQPLTYLWDFGDFTPTSTDANPMHTYTVPGVYIAVLTVSDGIDDGMDEVTVTVTVGNNDTDDDGVPNDVDVCPMTVIGEIVDADGCSVADLCPCENDWKNHGAYVRCVVEETRRFVRRGIMTPEQRSMLISAAAASNCGKEDDDSD